MGKHCADTKEKDMRKFKWSSANPNVGEDDPRAMFRYGSVFIWYGSVFIGSVTGRKGELYAAATLGDNAEGKKEASRKFTDLAEAKAWVEAVVAVAGKRWEEGHPAFNAPYEDHHDK